MAVIIDGTAGIANNATDLSYTGTLTGGTGVVNLGSGQVYKDASGNVGIGTASPGAKLNIAGGTAGTYADGILMSKSGGNFYGVYPDANDLIVRSVTAGTEVCRFTYGGNLLVGTTSASNTKLRVVTPSSTDGCVVELAGNGGTNLGANRTGASGSQFVLYNIYNGSYVGGISMTSTGTSFNTSSDYRLKDTIVPMTGALATVAALKPCTYKWKRDGSDGQGFIAHELAEVVPDCVTGEKDAVDAEGNPQYQGIDTSFLVATLTAAIQEQQTLITALTARITALEAPIV